MRSKHYAVLGVAAALVSFAALVLGQSASDPAARVAALRTRLANVTTRTARVDDINRIENLQGSYGYYTDKMLWDEVVDLFADGRHARDRTKRRLRRQGQHPEVPALA